MIYLDSDFLIHYLVVQNKESNRISVKRFEKLKDNDQAFISLLTLQEVSFVLGKLGMGNTQIEENLYPLEDIAKINYSISEFLRAKQLASKIGFQNINDCLHTAIAENYCKELYTFNKKDFEKIKAFTDLKITLF